MQQSLFQLIEDYANALSDGSTAGQIGIAILITSALIVWVLSALFPLRSQAEPEPDWSLAEMPATLEPGAEGYAGLVDVRHPAGVQLSHDREQA